MDIAKSSHSVKSTRPLPFQAFWVLFFLPFSYFFSPSLFVVLSLLYVLELSFYQSGQINQIFQIVLQTLKYVTGTDKWFPYDISCNLIRSADHTRVHQDCEPHEDEWTYLIYLTPNWTKNNYGETRLLSMRQ